MMHQLPVTINFFVKHVPGNEEHLKQIVKNYLQAKGVQTSQQYDNEGQPVHALVIEV